MDLVRITLFSLFPFWLSLAGAMLVERFAPALGLVQVPNQRSSHTRPTPRGGGLAVAVSCVGASFGLAASGDPIMWWIGVLGAAIALLGFQDDLRDLSVGVRLPIQIVIVGTLVWIMSPLPPMAFSYGVVLGGYLLSAVVIIGGVWWINLFNFMDGIDGIAASQSMVVAFCAIIIASWGNSGFLGSSVSLLMLAGISASAGLLLRNWSPARVFMGDVGSNFLAFVTFSYALITVRDGTLSYAVWLILVAAFATDASTTLILRVRRGERPWEAHKRHAYQVMSRRWGHSNVTLLFGAITLFWCGGLALFAHSYPGSEWLLVSACYLVLVPAAIAAGAGEVDIPPARP